MSRLKDNNYSVVAVATALPYSVPALIGAKRGINAITHAKKNDLTFKGGLQSSRISINDRRAKKYFENGRADLGEIHKNRAMLAARRLERVGSKMEMKADALAEKALYFKEKGKDKNAEKILNKAKVKAEAAKRAKDLSEKYLKENTVEKSRERGQEKFGKAGMKKVGLGGRIVDYVRNIRRNAMNI